MEQELNGEQSRRTSWKPWVSEPRVPSCQLPVPNLAQASTLLLLGIVHSELKDRRPLAAQKGHGRGCTCCTPFQAVDTATPVLGPKEVVAMVTQAKGMVQFRTLVYNLEWRGCF